MNLQKGVKVGFRTALELVPRNARGEAECDHRRCWRINHLHEGVVETPIEYMDSDGHKLKIAQDYLVRINKSTWRCERYFIVPAAVLVVLTEEGVTAPYAEQAMPLPAPRRVDDGKLTPGRFVTAMPAVGRVLFEYATQRQAEQEAEELSERDPTKDYNVMMCVSRIGPIPPAPPPKTTEWVR